VLLVGAGLMLRTFANLMRADVGLSTDGLIVTRVLLDPNRFPDGADRVAYFARLVPQLRAIPGVENVALTTGLPLNDMNFGPTRPYWREGETPPKGGGRKVRLQMISPGYFATTGTPLLTGRPFTERDDQNATPVAILNETLARQLWPNERAVGKRIIIDYLARGPYPYEVVGVMRDARSESLRDDAEPEIRLPHAQVPYNRVNVVIRASKQIDPRSLFGAIREAARRVDPTEPVHSVLLMSDLLRSATARERFTFAVLGAFSALALVVATAGLYAVAAASVARRTAELSIRAAIGASHHDLLSMILREGARLVVAGIAAGVVIAFALSETLRALLFGVAPFDATTYAAVAALLLCASVLGILSPARRAARTNAAALLRT
ncbi:MAG TPA: ABC transporter permease, partial [Thermoanaerobaculia bacterium]|nr:ABC transporter permease [Thermoanaerobaculia bacterium]